MSTRQFIILCFCLALKSFAFAQVTYRIGSLPSVNLNNPIGSNRAINLKYESRQVFWEGAADELSEDFKLERTDFSLMFSQKIMLNASLTGGYLIRFGDFKPVHRLIQQYIVVLSKNGYRLAHRFAADQTFSNLENPRFRLRYRISSEIPLNGRSLDPGEFYIKLSNEYLNDWKANKYDLEIRVVPLVGRNFKHTNKFEAGVDYRLNSVISGNGNHQLWFNVSWYIKLG